MQRAKIGIIGGSGLYQMPELQDVLEIKVDTPFGSPSDAFIVGTIEQNRVAFCAAWSRTSFHPDRSSFPRQYYAMKLLGVERILSASAVVLTGTYAPLDMVIPDQFLIGLARACVSQLFRRRNRRSRCVCPSVCDELGDVLEAACKVTDVKTHRRGTYLCRKDRRFQPKRSQKFIEAGAWHIGMTNFRSKARARGGDLLRHACASYRL